MARTKQTARKYTGGRARWNLASNPSFFRKSVQIPSSEVRASGDDASSKSDTDFDTSSISSSNSVGVENMHGQDGVKDLVNAPKVHPKQDLGEHDFSAFNQFAGAPNLAGLKEGQKLNIQRNDSRLVKEKCLGRVIEGAGTHYLVEQILSSKFLKSSFYYVPKIKENLENGELKSLEEIYEEEGTRVSSFEKLPQTLRTNFYIQVQARLSATGIEAVDTGKEFDELSEAITPLERAGITPPASFIAARKKYGKAESEQPGSSPKSEEDDDVVPEDMVMEAAASSSSSKSKSEKINSEKGDQGSKSFRDLPSGQEDLPPTAEVVEIGSSEEDIDMDETPGGRRIDSQLRKITKKIGKEKKGGRGKKTSAKLALRKFLNLQVRQAKRAVMGYPDLK